MNKEDRKQRIKDMAFVAFFAKGDSAAKSAAVYAKAAVSSLPDDYFDDEPKILKNVEFAHGNLLKRVSRVTFQGTEVVLTREQAESCLANIVHMAGDKTRLETVAALKEQLKPPPEKLTEGPWTVSKVRWRGNDRGEKVFLVESDTREIGSAHREVDARVFAAGYEFLEWARVVSAGWPKNSGKCTQIGPAYREILQKIINTIGES